MLNIISLNQHWNKQFYENAFNNFKCLNCNGNFDEINYSNNRRAIETFGGTELLYFFKHKQDPDFDYCSISFVHRKCYMNLSFSQRELLCSFNFLLNKKLIKIRSEYINSDTFITNTIYVDYKIYSYKEDYFFNKDQAIKYLDNLIFT